MPAFLQGVSTPKPGALTWFICTLHSLTSCPVGFPMEDWDFTSSSQTSQVVSDPQ